MDPQSVKATSLSFDFECNKVKLSSFKPVRIDTIGDGSCYFHAITNAIYSKYREEKANKRQIIKDLRSSLAELLKEKYLTLSRGHLPEIAKNIPSMSLENMQRVLRSSEAVGNEFQELVSETFEIDIYMLELARKDVLVMTGDDELLYKNRNSVVLISTGNHYELVGITNAEGKYDVYFPPSHNFIKLIKGRIGDLRKKK